MPSLFILVVPDSVEQLMAHSNLEGTSKVLAYTHITHIMSKTHKLTQIKHTKYKRIYRVYRRNIGDSFSLSATCRSRGGDIIEVTPSTHTAGG